MTNNPHSKNSGWSIYGRLLQYSRSYWLFFTISILGFAAYGGTQAALVHLLKYFVDSLGAANAQFAIVIPVAVILIALIRGMGFFCGNYYISQVALNIVNDLRKQMFDHMLILPSAFHDKCNSGELVSMITYNVNQVTNAATNAIKVLFREGFTVIALMGYLLYQNWQLTLVFLTITPVLAGLIAYSSKIFRRLSEKMQVSMGQVTHISNEAIQGYRLVRSYGGESYEKKRFHGASDKNTKEGVKFSRIAAIQTPVFQFILAIALAVLMYLVLLLASDATAGGLVAYVSAAALLAKPVRQLTEINSNIQKGIAAAESIFDLMDQPGEVSEGREIVERVSGRIEISNLSFSYEPGKPVLSDINLDVAPGETVALVGHSGSGKTTLASLLLRFYDYQQGTIKLDGFELSELDIDCLRQQIALVNQQVVLFNDTIANNIAYGQLASVDREEVIAAAERAYAMEFIEALDNGIDTIVGEDGTRLSGGQRQRISIARALLKNAPILILDEATSALDTESEKKIQAALEEVMRDRTTVVIAHRLSTIKNADRIVVLHEGRILEQGTHQELLEKNGAYFRLCSTEFSRETDEV